MASVEKSPIQAPNESIKDGNPGTCGPMGRSASPIHDPNAAIKGGNARGNWPDAKQASPVHPPDHRFNIADAKMPQPDSVVEPGKGAIPVNPFTGSGGMTAMAKPLPDSVLSNRRAK